MYTCHHSLLASEAFSVFPAQISSPFWYVRSMLEGGFRSIVCCGGIMSFGMNTLTHNDEAMCNCTAGVKGQCKHVAQLWYCLMGHHTHGIRVTLFMTLSLLMFPVHSMKNWKSTLNATRMLQASQ